MSDYFKTRREFLRTGIWGASATWTLPLFLQRTFGDPLAFAHGAAAFVELLHDVARFDLAQFGFDPKERR